MEYLAREPRSRAYPPGRACDRDVRTRAYRNREIGYVTIPHGDPLTLLAGMVKRSWHSTVL